MNIQSISETTSNWSSQRGIATRFDPETASTNDNAKQGVARENAPLALYVTGHQTKGRGRGANHWLDTGAGESLLSTWSLAVESAPQAITGPRVGLAVFNTVNSLWPSLAWSLKAPNDLILDGKKCGGLLVETISNGNTHRLLIGFGFNILNHPRKFADATHLSSALDQPVTEGQWFQFLDQLKDELQQAAGECTKPQLTPAACKELAQALNANPARKFAVQKVTPQGDLIHDGGTVSWMEL